MPKQTTLEKFGFRFARGGVHSSRTLMLAELHDLLSFVENQDASKDEYFEAIQGANCLGKRSGKTKLLTYRHLVELYTLDTSFALFRAFRFFWKRDECARPLLAALFAYSRDPIFRSCVPFVLEFQEGAIITRESLEEFIDEQEPGRFSKATLKSTAQNINSSLTQTSHLSGRNRKVRSRAVATPGSVSFALLLGFISGLRGESLLKSEYTQLLDCSFDKALELAEDASRKGWISLNRVGSVIEVRFPNLINAQEMELLRE